MRQNNQEIEKYRQNTPGFGEGHGNNGLFLIKHKGKTLNVIASDGGGWEHVSVSSKTRIPTWKEMCSVKELFFREDETVMQLHPKKSKYKNIHPHCLHLWRKLPTDSEEENNGLGLPPDWMV